MTKENKKYIVPVQTELQFLQNRNYIIANMPGRPRRFALLELCKLIEKYDYGLDINDYHPDSIIDKMEGEIS